MFLNVIPKYFACIGALFGLINIYIIKNKIKSIRINNNDKNEDIDINNFLKWYGICNTVPFLFIQVFQFLGNFKNVFYIFLLDFKDIYFVLSFITIILFWGLLLYSIFIKKGAEIILKYNKAFGNYPNNVKMIKLFHCLIVLVGLPVLLLGDKITRGAISYFYNNVFI